MFFFFETHIEDGWQSSILVSDEAHSSFCTVKLKHPTVGSWRKTFLLDPDPGARTERSLYLKITAAVAYFWPHGATQRRFKDIVDKNGSFQITCSSHTLCCQVSSDAEATWMLLGQVCVNTKTLIRFLVSSEQTHETAACVIRPSTLCLSLSRYLVFFWHWCGPGASKRLL